ncbi:MAG: DNA repair protein RecO [Clostridia bacterium]|nr:DNA repair protein RecO [Clostridia bacterium]
MNEIKTQAIVLSSTDYRDADKRLALFSIEYGLMFATIKGVKKPKAKLASYAQPFCFAEYLLSKKGDFYSVINASSVENFFNLTSNFDKYVIGTAILEFCRKTVSPNDPALGLFVLTLKALKALDMTDANPMAVLIRFLIDAFKQIGYELELSACTKCGSEKNLSLGFGYNYDNGGLVCQKCMSLSEALVLSPQEQAVFKNIILTDIDNISNLKFSGRDALVEIIKILSKQYRLYTGEELKSISEYI